MTATVKSHPTTTGNIHFPRGVIVLLLLVWIAAGVSVILPFAVGTSPLDAHLLRVPHEEGIWWHALIGLPFFFSLPMIWLHLRLLNPTKAMPLFGIRLLWVMVIFSALGTLLVESPFLLHRAGTSELQRLEVIFSGIGIIILGAIFLYVKRKEIHSTRALLIGVASAYLANAFLCLIIYGEAKFQGQPRSGWYLTPGVVFPMLLELMWLFFRKADTKKGEI